MAKRRVSKAKLNRLVFIGLIVIVIYYMTKKTATSDGRSGNIVPTDPADQDPTPPPAGGGSLPEYQYPDPAGTPGGVNANQHIGAGDTEGLLITGDNTQAYILPVGQNVINYEDLPDLVVDPAFSYTLGYGARFESDMPNDENGKLVLFKKGVKHMVHPRAYNRSRWSPENSYSFCFPQNTYKTAANWAVGSGQWNPAIHGDLTPMRNINSNVIPYETLTVAGAKLFGQFVADAVGSNDSIDQPGNYNISTARAHTMYDCENEPDRGWAHGSLTDFYGYVSMGMMDRFEQLTGEVNPAKLEIYGQSISWFQKSNINIDTEDITALATQAKNIILTNNHAFKGAIWGAKKTYVECGTGYLKMPYLNNSVKIYQTNPDGSIRTVNGRRLPRADKYSINVLGRSFEILPTPHDYIKWGLVNDTTGEQKLGWQHAFWGEYNPSAWVSPPPGWHWGNWVNSNPASWRPESELFWKNVYNKADHMGFAFLMLRRASTGNSDISYFDPSQNILPSLTDRPQSEPFTWLGNSIDIREIGEEGMKYSVYLYYLSGGRMYTTWDDGGYPSPWPSKGNPIYGKNDYWGRYIPGLAAYQSIFKELEGVNKSDLIYLHFYTPFVGQIKREVVSQAIYVRSSGKLLIHYCNPSLENTEKQTVKLRAGGSAYRVILTGREERFKVMNVPAGLTKNDFSLEYTTIYGENLKKRGVLTEDFLNHYI